MLTDFKILKDKLYDVKYDRIEQGLGLDIDEVDQYLRYKKRSFQHLRGTRQHREDYSNIVLTNGLLFKARPKMVNL